MKKDINTFQVRGANNKTGGFFLKWKNLNVHTNVKEKYNERESHRKKVFEISLIVRNSEVKKI